MNRAVRRAFVGVTAAALLLAIGGVVGATYIRSPAEEAARAKPPQPTVLTALVQRQRLRDLLTIRGTVKEAGAVSLTPTSEIGASRLVVTSVNVGVGDRVRNGDVLLSVSGRPLFVLHGAFPAYRNLVPGDLGPDVRELQAALGSRGLYRGGDPAGDFGPNTDAAVRAYYQSIGYPAVGTSGHAVTNGADTALVPLAEVAFVAHLPSTVASIRARVGGPVSAPLVRLVSGRTSVVGTASLQQAANVRPGMAGTLTDQVTGFKTSALVAAVYGSRSGLTDVIRVTPRRMPIREVGSDVAIILVVGETGGAVLTVPEAALRQTETGKRYVLLAGDPVREVTVRTGLAVDGRVAIYPTAGSVTVAQGQRVVLSA